MQRNINMLKGDDTTSVRVVLIADTPERHDVLRKSFGSARAADISLLFDWDTAAEPVFTVDPACTVEEGLALVSAALQAGRPYALAIIDLRDSPQREGFKLAARIWERNPDIRIVLATEDPDRARHVLRRLFTHTDRFVVLKSPLDGVEVRQLADALPEKWPLPGRAPRRCTDPAQSIPERETRMINAAWTAPTTSPDASRQAHRREALIEALRQALQRRELSLHYQPLIDLESRSVVGLEALLRWQQPRLGWFTSNSFMPVAELSGLVTPISEFVLKAVCEQIADWEREAVPLVPVAVNVTGGALASGQFDELVDRALKRASVEPHRLILDVAEHVLGRYALGTDETLARLRIKGVGIHLDDFGADASLIDFSALPIDAVKISRKLITQIGTHPDAEEFVREILTLTQCLGLRVIAVGVETLEQREWLRRHGCDTAQGFLFCRPLPAEECRELLLGLSTRPCITDTLRMKLASMPLGPCAVSRSSALELAERAIARTRGG